MSYDDMDYEDYYDDCSCSDIPEASYEPSISNCCNCCRGPRGFRGATGPTGATGATATCIYAKPQKNLCLKALHK